MAKIELVRNEKHMAGFFKAHLKGFWPKARALTFFHSKYLHFLSKESFLMRYELDLKLKNGRRETKIVRGNRVKPVIFEIMSYLWKNFSKQKKALVPHPLWYLKDLGYILYEEVTGWVLREFDSKPEYLIAAIPQIASSLALVHNLPVKAGGVHYWPKEEKFLKEQLKKIKRYYPPVYKKASELVGQLTKLQREVCQKNYFTLTHGDFQPSNIIYNVRTNQISLIDFSAAEIFAPANDLAIFLTHLEAMEKHLIPYQKFRQMENLFLKNYLAQANKKNYHLVKNYLGLYRARTCFDIIATTSVFMEFNKSPYYISLINLLFRRAQENLKLFNSLNNQTR